MGRPKLKVCGKGHDSWRYRTDNTRYCNQCQVIAQKARRKLYSTSYIEANKDKPKLCKRGHDNWFLRTNGKRYCKTCNNLSHSKSYYAKRFREERLALVHRSNGSKYYSIPNDTSSDSSVRGASRSPTLSREDELSSLIAQQERDAKYGDYQWGPHRQDNMVYLDSWVNSEVNHPDPFEIADAYLRRFSDMADEPDLEEEDDE